MLPSGLPEWLAAHQPRERLSDFFMRGLYGQCLRCNAAEWDGWSVFECSAGLAQALVLPRTSVNLSITHHVAKRIRLPRTTVVYYGVPDFVQSGAEPKDSRKPNRIQI